MQAIEHINSALVRHDWKTVVAGLAAGKVFIVENHGQPEAFIQSPLALEADSGEYDLEAHFDRVQARPPVPLAAVEITRAPEV